MFKRLITKLNNSHRPNKCKIAKEVELIDSKLSEYCNLAHHCALHNSSIGKRTSIGRYSKVRDSEIGAYCSISWDVTIGAVSHPMDRISMHAFTYRKQFGIVDQDTMIPQKVTKIGNDVWIGCGAIILSGVEVGDGAIIGAGAVVTKDIEPYTIVAGVPAKPIRKRFGEEIIEELLRIQWWNFSDEQLKANVEFFEGEITIEKIKALNKLVEESR